MRKLDVSIIKENIKEMCMEANYFLPEDVERAIKEAAEKENSPVGKEVFAQILKNIEIAKTEHLAICQDTGYADLFLEIGQEVFFTGGELKEAIAQGVREGYSEGYLRKSIVDDPVFDRKNTKDNTPPVIHFDIVPGDRVKITMIPKGGGSENMSTVRMMKPADGIEGIKDFVVKWVEEAGGNPCPPVVVGVGIGGTFEYAAYLAKKALIRPIGSRHPDSRYRDAEMEILERINKTGVGPMGLGGRITALDVHIETYPCHIASMPVGVNINCHVARKKERII